MVAQKEKEKGTTKKTNKIGGWAFIIGVVLALIAGTGLIASASDPLMIGVLMILGLVVGLLNITSKEAMPFLLIATALVVVSSLGGGVLANIRILQQTLGALIVFIIPAVIVVAIRAVFALARN